MSEDMLLNDDAEYINTDWIFDETFIGFASERVEREKKAKESEVKN